jgi:kynurenine formamidase
MSEAAGGTLPPGVPTLHEWAGGTPRLIVPAVVIDIRARAASDVDATVEVADLVAWEARHGRIPEGAAVLMSSGWDSRAGAAERFVNADPRGTPAIYCRR